MTKAPIVIFVYNRPEHTRRLLESMSTCEGKEKHDVYIFSDAAKNSSVEKKVEAVREIVNEWIPRCGFNKVQLISSEGNKGLAASIINGVNEVIDQYGSVIVLEDDLIVSADFIHYMQKCLEYYKDDATVGAVSAFSFSKVKRRDNKIDVYKSKTGNSWGWGTWKDVWNSVDWDMTDYCDFVSNKSKRRSFDKCQKGISRMLDEQMQHRINSWAVRWDYHFWNNNLWTIYPYGSRVINEGFDGSGTHCIDVDIKLSELSGDIGTNFASIDSCVDMTKITSLCEYENVFQRIKKRIVRKK